MLFPSILTCGGQIRVGGESGAPSIVRGSAAGGEGKGKRREPGWSGAEGELCRVCAVTLGTGGCWRVAQGFSLVQALPGCTRWLGAIPASRREISAGEHGGGAGGRAWVRGQDRAGCLGAEFPFLGYSCPPCATLGQGMHEALAPTAAPLAPMRRWGQAACWGACPRSLPGPCRLRWFHAQPPRQPRESHATQESCEATEL